MALPLATNRTPYEDRLLRESPDALLVVTRARYDRPMIVLLPIFAVAAIALWATQRNSGWLLLPVFPVVWWSLRYSIPKAGKPQVRAFAPGIARTISVGYRSVVLLVVLMVIMGLSGAGRAAFDRVLLPISGVWVAVVLYVVIRAAHRRDLADRLAETQAVERWRDNRECIGFRLRFQLATSDLVIKSQA